MRKPKSVKKASSVRRGAKRAVRAGAPLRATAPAKTGVTKTPAIKAGAAKTGAIKSRTKPPAKPRVRPEPSAVEAALAAFAHEVRTPLNGILAFAELLAAAEIPGRERRWAIELKGAAEHLAALTTLVVGGARAGARGVALRAERFRPRELAEAMAATLTVRAVTKGLAVDVAIAPDVPEAAIGDAVQLRAALENLIDNAVKFTEHGRVALAVAATPASRGRLRLTFSVADTGIGLTAAEIRRLFRPYAQAHAGIARRFGGAGLGLVFVRRIARAAGGDLTVESRAGEGTTFRLSVMVTAAAAEVAAESTGADAGPSRRVGGRRRRLQLLCAEDNPYGRVVLNTILTELGHRADFVGGGEAAVAAVARGGYDAVLMDVTMAGVDGLEATRRIRALPGGAAAVPIIAVSGRAAAADEAAARAAGMNGYLVKPVSPRALAEALAGVAGQDAEAVRGG